MAKCSSIDPLVTPYVDGELPAADRDVVDQHVRVCPPCRLRVVAERAVRELVRARKTGLAAPRASAALRTRCAVLRGRNTRWRASLAPFALAATLVIIVGGAFLYQATDRSARVMAAELAADHIKCFALNTLLGTHET